MRDPELTKTEDGRDLEPFPAQCRFCGIELNCMVDPEGVSEKPTKSAAVFSAAMLRKIAACNRCAGVRSVAWKVEAAYKKNADKLMIARIAKKDKAIEGEIREGFTRTTKYWMDYLCRSYRIADLWDDGVIETLITKPHASEHVTRMLREMVERTARDAWANTRHTPPSAGALKEAKT